MSSVELFEFDVFLSHNSADKPVVKELAERLRDDGLRVWLDDWVIQPGDLIPQQILAGLEKSRVLVMLLSRNLGTRIGPRTRAARVTRTPGMRASRSTLIDCSHWGWRNRTRNRSIPISSSRR